MLDNIVQVWYKRGMGMKALGDYLAQLREDAKLTQKQAAALVPSTRTSGSMSSKTIERWEAGANEPTLTILRRYVKALNGSVDKAVALLLSKPPEQVDEELTPEELDFFTSLSPARRRNLRALLEEERRSQR
jgi:transcriptional regulator with XRE-family HTH domain